MATKPKKPFGRSLSDFKKLGLAEKKLLEACRLGMPAVVGTGNRPHEKTEANAIHPDFLRFLILGGDEQAPVHEHGVQIEGAWIGGDLDLAYCKVDSPLKLVRCNIDGAIILKGAITCEIKLSGSSAKTIGAKDATVNGSFHLDDNFEATGKVELEGIRIEADFVCKDARFLFEGEAPKVSENLEEAALNIEKANISGLANFDAAFFRGCLKLVGARIGTNFQCQGTKFSLTVNSYAVYGDRAKIGGSVLLTKHFKSNAAICMKNIEIGSMVTLSNCEIKQLPTATQDQLGKTFRALDFQGAIVARNFQLGNADQSEIRPFVTNGVVWMPGIAVANLEIGNSTLDVESPGDQTKEIVFLNAAKIESGLTLIRSTIRGNINLSDSSASSIRLDSFSDSYRMILDGLKYSQLVDSEEIVRHPVQWLHKQPSDHLKTNFKPQPWEQLIKVLRNMGHEDDANRLAMQKQDALRAAGKINEYVVPLHWLFGFLTGYGYQPLRVVIAMLYVFFFAGLHYQWASDVGLMGPTSAIIQSDTEIKNACGILVNSRETQWTQCGDLPQEYTTFSPYWYSADLILPLVDLQQEKDWSPIVTKDDVKTTIWEGAYIRWVMWFEILFGWIASLLLVAVLGNLVKKD